MAYGLYISAEGATAQAARLEHLSNNLANVATPGFKRDLAFFQARYAEATERGQDYPGSQSLNDLGGGVMIGGTKTDFSQGPLKRTGTPTDLAIQGDGFFVVSRGNEQMLTRAGNFVLTPSGQLTTPDGYALITDDRVPVVIKQDGGPWQVTADGRVLQDGNAINIALVRPRSLGDLSKSGENLFMPLAAPIPMTPAEKHIASGYLEQSGVRPTQEMMELIEGERVFEANVNMVKNQDSMLGTLIEGVLKASS